MDEGTQREEMEAQVQQADTALRSARAAADNDARTAKNTRRTLDEVRFGAVVGSCVSPCL